jgi:CheY-like chemotaxis protein
MTGVRILIVEDEPLIAMMLEDFVETLGHSVTGVADNLEDGLAAVAGGAFDIAILDVNLRDRKASWPIADALDDAGMPFLLASGGDLDSPPQRHAARPYLSKPFTLESVGNAINSAASP